MADELNYTVMSANTVTSSEAKEAAKRRRRNRAKIAVSAAAAGWFFSSEFAHAANYTWVGNTSNTWSLAANWNGNGTAPPASSTLYFGAAGSSGTYLVDNINGNGALTSYLIFNAGASAFTIGDGTGTPNTGAILTIQNGITGNSTALQTIDDPIEAKAVKTLSGSGNVLLAGNMSDYSSSNLAGWTMSGSGTFYLSGTNIFSGNTTITSGTIQYEKTYSMSSTSAITVGASGTLAVNAGGMNEWTNGTSGAGTLGGLFAGTGGNGTISYATGSHIGIDTSDAGGSLTYSNSIAGGFGITKLGTGSLVLAASSSFTGSTNINNGTLSLGNVSALGTSSGINLNSANTTLQLLTDTGFGGANPVYNVSLSGSGPSSTIALGRATAGNSTAITHNFGNLTISGNNVPMTLNVTTGTNAPTGGAVDTLAFTNLVNYGNWYSVTETIAPVGTNVTIGNVLPSPSQAGGNGTYTQTLDLDGTSSGNLITGNISDNDGGSNNNLASILKTNSSTWTLSGSNSYSGDTILAGGILNVANLSDYGVNGSLGNRSSSQDQTAANGGDIGILFRGGTLQYTGNTAQSTNRAIRISTTGGGGTIDASGSTPSATVSFTAASSPNLWENGGSRTLTLTGSNTGNNTFGMALTDMIGTTSTGLAKSGNGTWVLTASNSYVGGTAINAGTLDVTNLSALGVTGSTVAMTGGNAMLQLLTDSGFGGSNPVYNVNLGGNSSSAATIALGRATAGNSTAITHNFGNLTISGNNVNMTLNVTTGINAPTGGAVDTLAFTNLVNYGNWYSETETIAPVGANVTFGAVAPQASGASNTFPAQTQTLDLDGTSSGNQITGNITDNNSGTINNLAAILKTNNSTWTLSGSGSSFTGNVTVSAGTLNASGATGGLNPTKGSLGNPQTAGRQITVGSGATLNFTVSDVLGNNNSAPVVTVVDNGGTVVNGPQTVTTLGNVTLNGGTLYANGGVNLGGSNVGSFNLNGTVTVTGTSPSFLNYNSAKQTHIYLLSSTGSHSTTFNVGSTNGNGTNDLTVSASVANNWNGNASTLIKSGAGIMALTAANTYSGGTLISGGTLRAIGTGLSTGNVTLAGGTIAVNDGVTTSAQSLTTGSQLWEANSGYTARVFNDGTADEMNLTAGTSTLTIDASVTTSNPFTVTATSAAGSLDPAANEDWVIAGGISTLSGVTAPTAGNPTVLAAAGGSASASGFILNMPSGLFSGTEASTPLLEIESVGGGGYSLDVVYSAAPEPGTAFLLLGGIAPMLAARRRRKRKVEGA